MSERYMRAYYYTFKPTGSDVIDAILEGVAMAGKAYHHTSEWSESWECGEDDGPSFWDIIQQRAYEAAEENARLRDERDHYRENVIPDLQAQLDQERQRREQAERLLREALKVMDEVGPNINENWVSGQQSKTERLGLAASCIDKHLGEWDV